MLHLQVVLLYPFICSLNRQCVTIIHPTPMDFLFHIASKPLFDLIHLRSTRPKRAVQLARNCGTCGVEIQNKRTTTEALYYVFHHVIINRAPRMRDIIFIELIGEQREKNDKLYHDMRSCLYCCNMTHESSPLLLISVHIYTYIYVMKNI